MNLLIWAQFLIKNPHRIFLMKKLISSVYQCTEERRLSGQVGTEANRDNGKSG